MQMNASKSLDSCAESISNDVKSMIDCRSSAISGGLFATAYASSSDCLGARFSAQVSIASWFESVSRTGSLCMEYVDGCSVSGGVGEPAPNSCSAAGSSRPSSAGGAPTLIPHGADPSEYEKGSSQFTSLIVSGSK